MRIAKMAPKPPILTIVTPVAVGTANALEKSLKDAGLQGTIVSQADVFLRMDARVEDFNWPDRFDSGIDSNEAVHVLKQIFHPLVMRGVPVIVTNQATASWCGNRRRRLWRRRFRSSTKWRRCVSGWARMR